MTVVEQVLGHRITLGGEPHCGWLPPGAAVPPPTPENDIDLDLKIERTDDGFLLIYSSRDGDVCGDTWHETVADARQQAKYQFDVPIDAWRSTSAG